MGVIDPGLDRVGGAGRRTAPTAPVHPVARDVTQAAGRRRIIDRASAGDPTTDLIDRAPIATTVVGISRGPVPTIVPITAADRAPTTEDRGTPASHPVRVGRGSTGGPGSATGHTLRDRPGHVSNP